jgi:hypothetical protein
MANWTRCPECGASFELSEPLYRSARASSSWETVERRQAALGAADLAHAEYHRQEPRRPSTVESDYLVPVLQAMASAVAGALLASAAAWLWGWPWQSVPAAGAVTFALAWLLLLRGSLARLMVQEHVIPTAPQEERPQAVTRIAVTLPGSRYQERKLGIPADRLVTLAKAVTTAGRPFSLRELAGRGRPLSGRAEFEELRDKLLELDWLQWRDPGNRQQGLDLTRPGRAALEAIAEGRARPEEL